MKNRYTLTSAAFLLALSVILGGCGGSGGGSKNFAAETTAASYEVAGGAAYDMAVPAMASEDGYWMEEKAMSMRRRQRPCPRIPAVCPTVLP